jgi:membrane dipeptidase
MRRPILAAILASTLISSANADSDVPAAVQKLHEESFVMDLHTDTLLIIEHLGYDFGERHWAPLGFMPWMGHVDIPRAREGGLDAMFMGIVANPFWGDGREQVRKSIRTAHQQVLQRYPDKVELARTADDLERITKEGKIAVQFLLEGAHGLGAPEGVEAFLDELYGQGLRVMGLAHFTDNEYAASSASSDPERPGLSEAGRRVIRHMNDMGIAVDLAHAHPQSFHEAIAISRAPVIVSHTGIKAQKNVFRNIDDAQIKAVAKTGGVIGVMYAPTWLSANLNPPIETVIEHMLHVKKLVGARHLALGSDYDGFIWLPKGMWDVTDQPKLTAAMVEAGFTAEEVRGILGENILRVMREVEQRATKRPQAVPSAAAN